MSMWYEASEEDIEIDGKCKEFNVLVTNDRFGNVYVTIKFAQVAAMMKAIEDEERQ